MRFLQIILLLILVAPLSYCSLRDSPAARNEAYFVKYYGESGDQTGVDILKANDGGFYILGSTQIRDTVTSSLEDSDIILIRTDAFGNELWRSTYEADRFTEAVKMDFYDGGIAIVGQIFEADGERALLVITADLEGNFSDLVWEYGRTWNYTASWIDGYPGGIAVIGTTDSLNESSIFSFNLDNMLQEKTGWNSSNGVTNQIDSGVAIVWQRQVPNSSEDEFLFVSTTDKTATNSIRDGLDGFNFRTFFTRNGNVAGGGSRNLRYYGNLDDQFAQAVAFTEVGNIYIAGNTTGNSPCFVSTNSSTTVSSDLAIVNTESVRVKKLAAIGEEGFALIGERLIGDLKDIYLARISNTGDIVWEKTFGFPEFSDTGGNVVELDDGSIVFSGTIRLDNQDKICLIKVKSDGSMRP